MKFKPLLLLWFTSLLFSTLCAQVEEPPVYTIDFRAISWSGMLTDVYYQSVGASPARLTVPVGTRSSFQRYRGTSPLTFFRIVGKDEDGNPIKKPVASLPLQANGSDLLVNFIEIGSETRLPYRLFVIAEQSDEFPFGTCLFYNFTRKEVAVAFGSSLRKIAPADKQAFSLPEAEANFQVRIADQNEAGNWKSEYSSVWSGNQDERIYVLALNHPNNPERILIKSITENRVRYEYELRRMEAHAATDKDQ